MTTVRVCAPRQVGLARRGRGPRPPPAPGGASGRASSRAVRGRAAACARTRAVSSPARRAPRRRGWTIDAGGCGAEARRSTSASTRGTPSAWSAPAGGRRPAARGGPRARAVRAGGRPHRCRRAPAHGRAGGCSTSTTRGWLWCTCRLPPSCWRRRLRRPLGAAARLDARPARRGWARGAPGRPDDQRLGLAAREVTEPSGRRGPCAVRVHRSRCGDAGRGPAVHGRPHLPERGRVPRAAGRARPPRLPADHGQAQGGGPRARPVEPVPPPPGPRRPRHQAVEPRLLAHLRAARQGRRSPPRSSTARRPTRATWRSSTCTGPSA